MYPSRSQMFWESAMTPLTINCCKAYVLITTYKNKQYYLQYFLEAAHRSKHFRSRQKQLFMVNVVRLKTWTLNSLRTKHMCTHRSTFVKYHYISHTFQCRHVCYGFLYQFKNRNSSWRYLLMFGYKVMMEYVGCMRGDCS